MNENHWKSFHQSLPEDGIPIRVKESPAKMPILMIRHGKTLKYQIQPDDPWQGVGVFTEYVFSHCVWCYDSQYTPEPLRDNNPPLFPQEHFLKWVTIHRPQTYNELLREYHDFCKDNPETAPADYERCVASPRRLQEKVLEALPDQTQVNTRTLTEDVPYDRR